MISKILKLPFSSFYTATLLITVLLPAVARADVPLDRIVAVVNEDVIMESELQEKIRTVRNQLAQAKAEAPPGDILEKQVLEKLILNKLQLQFAATTGILVDDETLNRTINNIAEENHVNLTQFREILERDGFNYEKFREDIRNEIIISRLKQRQVDNRITVTDREIDNYLANEQHQGGIENEYRISHILISIPEAATAEETEQARLVGEKVLEDLANGEDFAKLAATVSEGQQTLQGGDLGWRKASEVPSLFADQIAKMKEGDVSKLIQSPGGFHIIKLTGLRTGDKFIVTQAHARHILLKLNELLTEEDAKTRLEQLKLRAEGGDDFAELAKAVLDSGFSVLVDATFLKAGQRELFQQLATASVVPFLILDFQASEPELCRRIKLRQQHKNDASEATPVVLQQQLQSAQPLTEKEQLYVLTVDTESANALTKLSADVATFLSSCA